MKERLDVNKYRKFTLFARILGICLLLIGITLDIFGVIEFMNQMSNPSLSGATSMIKMSAGGFLTIGGIAFIVIGFGRKINEFNATQVAPTIAKTTNYLYDENKDNLTDLVSTIRGKAKDKVICKKCNTENDSDHLYCSSCGASLKTNCPNCNELLGPDDKFCPKCGKKVL